MGLLYKGGISMPVPCPTRQAVSVQRQHMTHLHLKASDRKQRVDQTLEDILPLALCDQVQAVSVTCKNGWDFRQIHSGIPGKFTCHTSWLFQRPGKLSWFWKVKNHPPIPNLKLSKQVEKIPGQNRLPTTRDPPNQLLKTPREMLYRLPED